MFESLPASAEWDDAALAQLVTAPLYDDTSSDPSLDHDWFERAVAADPERPRGATERLREAEAATAVVDVLRWIADVDGDELNEPDRLTLAELWQRTENFSAGGKVEAIGALAGPAPANPDDVAAFVWSEISPALAIGDVEATRLVQTARRLRDDLPATRAASRSGHVSLTKVHRLVEATQSLTREQCRQVEGRVLPFAATRTPQLHAQALRRAVKLIDPEGAAKRYERAQQDVRLVREHHGDGMGDLFAHMNAVDLETVWSAADAFARRCKAAGDARTLDQLRVAALVDWAERFLTRGDNLFDDPDGPPPNPPTRHGRPITLNLVLSLPALLGLTEESGELLPVGAPIPAAALRDLVPDAELRRLIIDPMTGHLLDHGRRTYRVPAGTAAFVAARDVTATTPSGSHAAAGAQDLDHMQAWDDGGPTDRSNLHSPTRRWHRAKTFGNWLVTRNRDGTETWTSRLGRTYIVRPYDYSVAD